MVAPLLLRAQLSVVPMLLCRCFISVKVKTRTRQMCKMSTKRITLLKMGNYQQAPYSLRRQTRRLANTAGKCLNFIVTCVL